MQTEVQEAEVATAEEKVGTQEAEVHPGGRPKVGGNEPAFLRAESHDSADMGSR